MKLNVTIWIVLCIGGLFLHEIIDVFIRPNYGKGLGWIPFFFGVIPNFLAAGFIFPFGGLTIRDHYTNNDQKRDPANLSIWFWTSLFGSQLGLILWELVQRSGGNLIYDPFDVLATILGGMSAILIFILGRKSYLAKLPTSSKKVE